MSEDRAPSATLDHLKGPGPLLRTPERRLSRLEACRALARASPGPRPRGRAHPTMRSRPRSRPLPGRAYSAGVSNVGVYAHPAAHGALALSRLHFGISQTVSAPSISVSAVTVAGAMCLSVQYATPIWPHDKAAAYADDLLATLQLAAKPSAS